jgi:hypothetical protein
LTFCRLSSAAPELLEIAKAVEPVQDGRIHIEKINEPFLYKDRGTPAEYGAGSSAAPPYPLAASADRELGL